MPFVCGQAGVGDQGMCNFSLVSGCLHCLFSNSFPFPDFPSMGNLPIPRSPTQKPFRLFRGLCGIKVIDSQVRLQVERLWAVTRPILEFLAAFLPNAPLRIPWSTSASISVFPSIYNSPLRSGLARMNFCNSTPPIVWWFMLSLAISGRAWLHLTSSASSRHL